MNKKEKVDRKNYLIKKIKIANRNTNSRSIALLFSDFVSKFTNALCELRPNIFVVFGDRYEMFAAAISAYILRIPIVHIAGGEKTAGSIDDGFRHSISKLSNLHFPITAIYRKRLIQLGENPKSIFNFGSLNLVKIKNNHYLSKIELEKKLNIKFYEKNLIITYHPDTIDNNKSLKNLSILLNSLMNLKKTGIIITAPNNDLNGNAMTNYIKKFIGRHNLKNFLFFKSLGSQIYLSLLKIVDGVVGNSSSGLSEVPFFGIGTVNIGDRQQGRVMELSVVNCQVSKKEIIKSVNKIINNNFKRKNKKTIKNMVMDKLQKKY